MSAVDTASSVLRWAISETTCRRAAPGHGDLGAAAELAEPPPDLRAALGALAAVTSARLRLPAPPLGDGEPPGPGAILLAAAAGGRGDPPAALAVLSAAGTPGTPGGWELVARHGVADAALGLPDLDQDLTDLLRDLSPLTALLDHPTPQGEREAELVLTRRLLPRPEGRRLATLAFAAPAANLAQAEWRSRLLSRCRRLDPAFVLDVYETGLSLFEAEHLRRLRAARRLLAGHGAGRAPAGRLAATALWWRALEELSKSAPGSIRRRRRITVDHVDGIALYRALRRLEAAA